MGLPDRDIPVGPAFVTGASGFIGRHLLRALLGQGRQVVALCRRPSSLSGLEHPRLRILASELENVDAYAKHLDESTAVFHLAALRHRKGATLEEYDRTNVQATLELARASAERRVARFVYVSSAGIYGPYDGRPVSEDGLRRSPTTSAYLLSRLGALDEMRRLAEEGLPLVTVCPSIVFGPDHPSHPNIVTSHFRRLLRTGISLVVAGGRQRKDFVYVKDVARGLLAAERLGSVGEEYILSGEDVSFRQLDGMVFSLAGLKPRLSLSVPGGLARKAARAADRLKGYHRGSGYEAAVESLLQEKLYSCEKARRSLCYTWSPLRDSVLETIEFIKSDLP